MLVGGQETWHPNPDIFFADGAGPLLDMGPYYLTAIVALLGPVRRVAGFASMRTRERTIEIGPRAGERFAVGDADAHGRVDGARVRRDREPRRELRGDRPVRLRPRDPRHRGRARAARPERVRGPAAADARARGAGRRFQCIARRPRCARHRPARARRGDRAPAARRARRAGSASTSSRSPAASSARLRRVGRSRSSRGSTSPRRCPRPRSPRSPRARPRCASAALRPSSPSFT